VVLLPDSTLLLKEKLERRPIKQWKGLRLKIQAGKYKAGELFKLIKNNKFKKILTNGWAK